MITHVSLSKTRRQRVKRVRLPHSGEIETAENSWLYRPRVNKSLLIGALSWTCANLGVTDWKMRIKSLLDRRTTSTANSHCDLLSSIPLIPFDSCDGNVCHASLFLPAASDVLPWIYYIFCLKGFYDGELDIYKSCDFQKSISLEFALGGKFSWSSIASSFEEEEYSWEKWLRQVLERR